jgi:hypothetical protein
MQIITSLDLWATEFPRGHEPYAYQITVRCIECNGRKYFKTPWAMLDYGTPDTSPERLRIMAGENLHDTEEAAQAAIRRRYPFWDNQNNREVMGRIDDAARWNGQFGPSHLADAIGVSLDRLYDLARGKIKATTKQAQAARDYHGLPV